MTLLTLFLATFLFAAIFLLHVPSTTALANDDAMFEFAKTQLDRTSTTVRRRTIARPRPGKTPKVTSTGPNNYYLTALMQVQKAMAVAKGMRRTYNDRLIKETAILAARSKRIPEALSALGVGMFNDFQRYNNCIKKRRPNCRRIKTNGIAEQLRAILGDDGFNDLMSVDGDVTLVFVVDTTYSMHEEINEAKTIITEIANYQREGHVDYVLSPFNDPGTGPVHGKQNDIGKFLAEVKDLDATGGRDCKEKTFHGIIDAIEKGSPRVGSPMYVFTDAGPKDKNFNEQYNLDNAAGLASEYSMRINFFFSTDPGGCRQPNTFESFKSIIEETEGIGILFGSGGKLSQMSDVVKASLDGMTTIKSGGSSRRRRPGPMASKTYRIPVDNTVTTLIITATVETNPSLILLRDPRGSVVSKKYQLSLGAIWLINSPRLGSWTLVVPGTVGRHSFKVSSSSLVNIDFDHYFVWVLPRSNHVEFPIDHPLENRLATVKLLIPLKNKLNVNSLSLEIVSASDGSLIRGATLSGITATFIPPSTPFKLRLKGQTASGYPFARISRKVIKARSTLLRTVRNRNYIILPKGRRSTTRYALHNVGPSDSFKFSLTTSTPGVNIESRSSTYRVSSGRVRYFSARLTPSASLHAGQSVHVLVTATYASSGKIASKLRLNFLIK